MKLQFFSLGGESPPFKDFENISIEQTFEAIEYSKSPSNPFVELYLSSRDWKWKEPQLGLVFENGVYIGHGLGDEKGASPESWATKVVNLFKPFKNQSISKEMLTKLFNIVASY